MNPTPVYRTEQESFWAGEFGDGYADRNQGERLVASNTAFLAKVLARATAVTSVIEFGANIGLNLMALRRLLPLSQLSAIEINQKAVARLQTLAGMIGNIHIHPQSIFDFTPNQTYDLTLIKGVLIHIAPDMLPTTYDLLYRASGRYICVAEYYNTSPVEVPYRGHTGKLFKRDFAGELLDTYPDLRLVDYGFAYRRDPQFPQDDITWFLLEKL